MTQTQHTPKPWKATGSHLAWHVSSQGEVQTRGDFVRTQNNLCVCTVAESNPAEMEANAHLIAAAPDLLEAAILACRVWPDQMRGSTLEAAIAKATGQPVTT